MIGKVIWLGLVWLLYPYAMVPYIYESIHPIKLQVIQLLKKDMSEPGTRDCSNAWWYLGDEYGGSPPKRLTFDTQQPIDARDRSRWWTDRCRLSYPSPPPPLFCKSGASAPWFHFDSKFRCNIFGLGSLPLESGAVCCLKYKGTRSSMTTIIDDAKPSLP